MTRWLLPLVFIAFSFSIALAQDAVFGSNYTSIPGVADVQINVSKFSNGAIGISTLLKRYPKNGGPLNKPDRASCFFTCHNPDGSSYDLVKLCYVGSACCGSCISRRAWCC